MRNKSWELLDKKLSLIFFLAEVYLIQMRCILGFLQEYLVTETLIIKQQQTLHSRTVFQENEDSKQNIIDLYICFIKY